MKDPPFRLDSSAYGVDALADVVPLDVVSARAPSWRIEPGARLQILQVLRLAAALAVVGVHLPNVGRGDWGVDLFFVISGFVMCLSTEASRDAFIRRRLIRVVPLYWALTAAVFIVALQFPSALDHTKAEPGYLVKSLLFVPFYKDGQGYSPLYFLGWTLNFEMAFYGLFALALLGPKKMRIAVASALVLSLHCVGRLAGPGSALGFYGNPIILEFVMGMLVYALMARPEAWRMNAAVAAAMLVAGLLLTAPDFDDRAVHSGLASAAVLAISLGLFARMPIPPLIVLLGDASYALYLVHPFVINSVKVTGLFDQGAAVAALATAAAVGLSLAVSAIVWVFIDQPFGLWLRRRLIAPGTRAGRRQA